jgi:hypothetical protein
VDDWGLPLKSQEYCAAGLEDAWQERQKFASGWKCETGGDVMGGDGPSGAMERSHM